MSTQIMVAKWKANRVKKHPAPPNDFLSKLQPTHINMWAKTEEDWYCPICKRNKFSIVSYNQNNEPIYVVYRVKGLAKPEWRNIALICESCWTVAQRVKQHLTQSHQMTIDSPYEIITPEDLEKIFTAESHCQHQVNPSDAEKLIETILINQSKNDNITVHSTERSPELTVDQTHKVIFDSLLASIEVIKPSYTQSGTDNAHEVITDIINSLIYSTPIDLSRISLLEGKQFYAISKILRAFCYKADDCKSYLMQHLNIQHIEH